MTTAASTLYVLCAGAAKGLVTALQPRFEADTGARLEGQFGAVGAMRDTLRTGAPCDVMVVTAAMIDELAERGELVGATRAELGRVRTGIAVRVGDPVPAVASGAALRAALLAAERIYFPDPERATAGIHFVAVLRKLGIHDALAARFATFANGATAMRELSLASGAASIGCTQITEINYTAGVRLAGSLPAEFELATVYGAAVGTGAQDPELAARFVALLTGETSRELRLDGGFELEPARR